MKPIFVTDRRFTGDTGCALDYQIGFEDECGGYCNFLGIGDKKEQKRRAEVLAAVRKDYYPSPGSCVTGSELLPMPAGGIWKPDASWTKLPCGSACQYVETKIGHLRKDIQEAQRKIDSGESKDVAPRYLEAFNTVLAEYTNYYNNNCLVGDPIAQTATPSGSTAALAADQKPTATNGIPAANAGASLTAGLANNNNSQDPSDKTNWLLWAGVAAAVITVAGIVIYRHNKNKKAKT